MLSIWKVVTNIPSPLSLRFGGFLVSIEKAQVGDIITVFFSILVGAFYFGQGGPNIQKLTEAQAVAAPIYDIIDRVFLATLYII